MRQRGISALLAGSAAIVLVGALAMGPANAVSAEPSVPAQIAGKVIHVADGDTLELLDAQRQRWTIRLSDVDAPETGHGQKRPGQPYGARATQHVKQLAIGQAAEARCFDADARQRDDGTARVRYVCSVQVNGHDLAASLLDAGLAMANRASPRYIRDRQPGQREARARSQGLGLWSQPNPIAPWEWRRSCWVGGRCDGAAGGHKPGVSP